MLLSFALFSPFLLSGHPVCNESVVGSIAFLVNFLNRSPTKDDPTAFSILLLTMQNLTSTGKEARVKTIVDSLSVACVNVCGEWRDAYRHVKKVEG